ncbi:hypothetical protein [Streptomyces sp. NBC_01718]|uniref:hypothetical protein n=1 Tax=Streptomyces sp. NBC_01718 TaxID=2975919 RepID=UPI002F913567
MPSSVFWSPGLGLGAIIASYGTERVAAANHPCAAIAWLSASLVAAVLAWGLGEHAYPGGYAVAAFQLLVGAVLLPGYLRRSGSKSAHD